MEKRFCRSGLHPMTGDNVIRLSDGKRRCRACWSATRKRIRRELELRVKASFSEPLENLSLTELGQRLDQVKVMVETAETQLKLAQKATQRYKIKFERVERREQKAREIYQAAVKLFEQVDRLRTEKANAEGRF
jgi:uncharacterized protein Yka (UPF0111/DUF47 family)